MPSIFRDKRYIKAKHLLSINRYEEANQLFMEILAEYPQDGTLLYQISECLFLLDRFEEAAEFGKQSLQFGCPPEQINHLMGKIYWIDGKYYEAEQCFLNTLEIVPNDAETLSCYSRLMQDTGFYDKAAFLMDQAMQLEPMNPRVLWQRYLYCLNEGSLDERSHILGEYVVNGKDEISKNLLAGFHYYVSRDYKMAREHFLQVFLMDPSDQDSLNRLKAVDRKAHPLFLPQRMIKRIGGIFPFFIIWMIMVVILTLEQTPPSVIHALEGPAIYLLYFMLLYPLYLLMAIICYRLLFGIKELMRRLRLRRMGGYDG